MYITRRRVFWGDSPHLPGESLATYSKAEVLLQLKVHHQYRWVVDLSPLDFSGFHSGFYMLLSQNHHTLNVAFIGKGERKNF